MTMYEYIKELLSNAEENESMDWQATAKDIAGDLIAYSDITEVYPDEDEILFEQTVATLVDRIKHDRLVAGGLERKQILFWAGEKESR